MLDALGRGEEARADLLVLTAIDPLHRNAAYWRRRLGKSDREACESLSRQELNAEAISACSALLALSPDDAQVNYWLGRAYLQGGEFEAAKAALHAAIRADPRHRPSIENLDWLYGRSRDWPPVLELWNDYLALEPEDAKALLERAGTHVQMGDRSAGCRDLERSCELGNGEACAIARRRC
jgi:tetratricopeptide (TPR) repeat protein